VTINLLNRAPVSSDADGVVVGDAFGAAVAADLSIVATTAVIDGTAATNTVPTGWTKVGSPDINDSSNTAWAGGYTLSNVEGTSLNGGTFIELVGTYTSTESMSAPLSGLTVGKTYTYGVQWQQLTLTGLLDGYGVMSGGQLNITIGGVTKTFTSSGLNDGWQTALVTFVATSTSMDVTLAPNTTVGSVGVTGGVIAVDSMTAAQIASAAGVAATAAQSVEALFGPTYTDADFDTMRGVTITSAGTASDLSSLGKYQYQIAGTTTWVDMPAGLNDSGAVFLAKADLIRFVPSSTNTSLVNKQDLTARLVDDSAATAPASGSTVNVSVNGGSTPYSDDPVTLRTPVTPVVLDLNRDGELNYANVLMDVNSDGVMDNTLWAGMQDGVLVWDKYHDGKVHNQSQYAFTEYGGSTDLEGLAAGFDTNRDGVFSMSDEKFGEFKVWQDLDQDGVFDAGEVRSLADLGINQINLVSDGVQRAPVAGVTEAGRSTANLADGSTMLVADALFAYNALDYNVTGNAMSLLGSNMTLNLSSIVAVHSNVTAMDLTGTGANTLKLNLADVLSLATDASIANGVHKLTLTGDANDTVQLDLSQWANTGTTVTEGDHTYAVYNASSAVAAQLLIDQHMVLANHA
jgi:hypothetical protein